MFINAWHLKILPFLGHVWDWLASASPAPLVTVEIAIVGLIVSWLQLRYMRRRDRSLDIKNGWEETHKLMIIFRFKRELLNISGLTCLTNAANAMNDATAALESLHILKGQLDRMPDCALVQEIADFLHANEEAEKWRSQSFEKRFDEYARQVASLSRPPTHL